MADISLRPVAIEDARRLLEWVNAPDSLEQREKAATMIAWPEHEKWFSQRLVDPGTHMFIVEADGEIIGQVRLQAGDGGFAVDIYIIPMARQGGHAKRALAIALSEVKERSVIARVKATNHASRRLFQAAGFHEISHEDEMVIFKYEGGREKRHA